MATKSRDCFFFSFFIPFLNFLLESRFHLNLLILPAVVFICRTSNIEAFSPSSISHGLINETAENKSKLTILNAKLKICLEKDTCKKND